MVICSNCGNSVMEGKFCEKCGKPLVPRTESEQNVQNLQSQNLVCPNCGATNNNGKFCEQCGTPLVSGVNRPDNYKHSTGLFDKISSSVNKSVTDFMAVKSDFSNGTIIYLSKKVPSIQEKKIKLESDEIVFYNNGTGFVKHNQTFTTQDNNFICYFLKNTTVVQNNLILEIKTPIKNLNDVDLINVKINYNLKLIDKDIDEFFNSMMTIRQDTWRIFDINTMLSTSLNKIVSETIVKMLKEDGDIDLRNPKDQINNFLDVISDLINNEVSKYGLKVDMFELSDVETSMEEINEILIKNLYNN